MNPLVSVIVPVYNAGQYLQKCIESIINQQLKHIEIILIDDGSVDNSGKICDEYAKIDNRIRVSHTKNQGVSKSRNIGIELAKGDYIGFVDSDDWIDEVMYSNMLTNIVTYNADIVMCDFVIFDGENKTCVEFPWKHKSSFVTEEIVNKIIPPILAPLDINGDKHKIIMGSVCRCLFRSDVIKNNGITFDTKIRYSEDLVFLLQYLIKAKSVMILRVPHYYYRQDKKARTGTTQKYVANLYSDLKYSNMYIKKILTQEGLLYKMSSHFKWRCASITITSIYNLCKRGSPFNFYERVRKARYYISDNDFKMITIKLRPVSLVFKYKIVITMINHSLVSLLLVCSLKHKTFFKNDMNVDVHYIK